jgi:fibronectin-binding autotransporter adhesin
MKTESTRRHLLAIAASSLMAVSSASAATYYWDSNSTTAGFGNTAGTWGSSTFWSTNSDGTGATANTTITSADTVNFGTATLAYGTGSIAIGIASGGVTTGGIVIGAGQNQQITLGTSGNALTIHGGGITKNAGSANFIISSPIILGAAQTWTNNSSTNLSTPDGTTNFINNGGFDLTVDGTGTTVFGVLNPGTQSLSGSGALIKNGTGTLQIGGNNTGFSGNITVNNGTLYYGDNVGALGTGNINITNGIIEGRWDSPLSRAQGTGAGQIQITGGVSGFSNGRNQIFAMGASATWGSSTFNPTEFVLQGSGTGSIRFSTAINLNGADRTIRSNNANTAGIGNFTGVISGTGAGIIKEGVGHQLFENAANTYSGATTINAGILTAQVLANGSSNSSIGSSSNAASNLVIGNGATFRYSGSGHSTNRSFTINGTADGHGASLDASGGGAANWTNTATPAYGTVDQTRTLTPPGPAQATTPSLPTSPTTARARYP